MDINMKYINTVNIMCFETILTIYYQHFKNTLKTPDIELYAFKMQVYKFKLKFENLENIKKKLKIYNTKII